MHSMIHRDRIKFGDIPLSSLTIHDQDDIVPQQLPWQPRPTSSNDAQPSDHHGLSPEESKSYGTTSISSSVAITTQFHSLPIYPHTASSTRPHVLFDSSQPTQNVSQNTFYSPLALVPTTPPTLGTSISHTSNAWNRIPHQSHYATSSANSSRENLYQDQDKRSYDSRHYASSTSSIGSAAPLVENGPIKAEIVLDEETESECLDEESTVDQSETLVLLHRNDESIQTTDLIKSKEFKHDNDSSVKEPQFVSPEPVEKATRSWSAIVKSNASTSAAPATTSIPQPTQITMSAPLRQKSHQKEPKESIPEPQFNDIRINTTIWSKQPPSIRSPTTLTSSTSFSSTSPGKGTLGPVLRPRGLINNGNMCFMNAILQPLVHCSLFYNAFRDVAHTSVLDFQNAKSLTEAMLMFLNEFSVETDSTPTISAVIDQPFLPEYVYDAIRSRKRIDKGRQEDAEEFLGYLLDGLHEEFLAYRRKMNGGGSSMSTSSSASDVSVPSQSRLGDGIKGTVPDDDTWFEVGKKKKAVATRRVEMAQSPVSHIFVGTMRSVLRAHGKESATLEPFQTLPLDISSQYIKSINDALVTLTDPESLEGYRTGSNSNVVDATKTTFLESLPPVLILHLKRFVFDAESGGTQKVHKFVTYPKVLKITNNLLSPTARLSNPQYEYQLSAVVYHHGKQAGGGHYTCDVRRVSGDWFRMDDTEMQSVSEADVLKDRPHSQAYMLFYERK